MNAVLQPVTGEITQWVTFSLDDETYGIDVMQVQEVLRVSEVAPVPGAPHYVLGIINLRGNVVTVIDTRTLFGLTGRDTDDGSRVVIIESNQQVVGMLVDGVAEVVDIPSNGIESAPSVGNDDSAKYIQGVFSRDDTLYILLELNKLLTDDEWNEMGGF